MGAAFLLQYLAAEFRRKDLSGGKVGKAPARRGPRWSLIPRWR
jgi:hypothetical protein